MPQSLVKNLIHLVYSTKHRMPWILRDVRERLCAHHRSMSFVDELRTLFHRHGIEFDERYVWD